MNKRSYLMKDWTFCEQFSEEMITEPIRSENAKKVAIPHTCKETPFHYFDESLYQMECCYQRTITAPEAWQGQVVLLTFEAVGHEADVYLNGTHLCKHKNGYTAFTVDLSDELRYGAENLLTVRVNTNENINQPPFGYVIDYMTYGGIYRDVYLEVKHPVHIRDVFVKPTFQQKISTRGMKKEEIASLLTNGLLTTEMTLSEEAKKTLADGKLGMRQMIDGLSVMESPNASASFSTIVKDVKIWDIESPMVYDVTTQLLLEDEVVDEITVSVGFRDAVFKKDGFYLNGRKVKIRGLNRHQSYAYVGYAMPESMQCYDARILKHELAANAVRTSHYPQSHYFVDECDRLGLLVFTEIPGWQHIGDDAWQDIAVENVKEMVKQYRNHPSIILWGVRINESPDNDALYKRTNEAAHALDDTRATGGVRCIKNSHLFEDVYTYNDFVHSGSNMGCEPKSKVTSDVEKPYLISEYNGHMFPTKNFDCEEHRREHMIRHANVLDAVTAQDDIAGSFAWCMFDYNTHKDFGSGDRICYHGVMDMFRNPKLAASVYAAQGDEKTVLELSSSMDIGEHPACNRGNTYLISNADSVRMYKNNLLIKEYTSADSEYKHLANGPILLNDYVGDVVTKAEGFTKRQGSLVKYCLNSVAVNGMKMTPKLILTALELILFYHMKPSDAVALYNKYVGDWGGESREYRFDAVKDGRVVKSIVKNPMCAWHLEATCSHTKLMEKITYDVAEIHIKAVDENGNQHPFMQEMVKIETEGPIEVIGPDCVPLRGGMSGIYIKTTGTSGDAKVILRMENTASVEIKLQITQMEEETDAF